MLWRDNLKLFNLNKRASIIFNNDWLLLNFCECCLPVGTYKLTQSRHAVRNIPSAFICNTDLGCSRCGERCQRCCCLVPVVLLLLLLRFKCVCMCVHMFTKAHLHPRQYVGSPIGTPMSSVPSPTCGCLIGSHMFSSVGDNLMYSTRPEPPIHVRSTQSPPNLLYIVW